MSVVKAEEVQQWLESSKLDYTTDTYNSNTELETTAQNIVFAQLNRVYDITSWTDADGTPALVREVISMLVAAWIYERAYAEDYTDSASWSKKIEDRAYALLAGIRSGQIDLEEVEGFLVNTSAPSFYPNDLSVDEYGEPETAAFRMGQRF